MSMGLGFIAIAFTIIHLGLFLKKQDTQLFMGLGLSFTALTLWSFYHDFVTLYKAKDVASIEDVALYMGTPLLVLTLISIGLNMIPVLIKKNK